jgi:hypothetical protein
LLSATQSSAFREGKRKLAKSIKTLKETGHPLESPIKKMNESEALALLADCNLTKRQYLCLKMKLDSCGAKVFPSYERVGSAKTDCYPDGIEVSAYEASVPLKNLLAHTAKRIVCLSDNHIRDFLRDLQLENLDMIFYFKWGYDGSSGQLQFNQELSEGFSDANLIAVTVTPLRLTTVSGVELWDNPVKSSTRYCRPLLLKYAKETKELNLKIQGDIQAEIDELESQTFILSDKKAVTIKFSMHLTQIDGSESGLSSFACKILSELLNLRRITKRNE